jgi:hypothetical protein
LIVSAASSAIFSVWADVPPSRFTRFPQLVKMASKMEMLFTTSHSDIASRIRIRRMFSKRNSSGSDTDSLQNPMTKNSTTSELPMATKYGSTDSMYAQAPPP